MSIPLEAVVGELHIVGGTRQGVSRPTAALVAPRHAARGRAGETLLVLVELRGPEPLPYEAVIDRIEATYWRTPGSVTSALRAALGVTNDWLMDRNVQAEVSARVRAGISCAVLREAQVYIAQAGPAAAYVAHHGQVERFPAREVTPQALGASRAVEVRFSHAMLSPGDVVLLCDSVTAERTADEAIAGAIVYTGVEAALQNLEKLAGSNDLVALIVEGAAEARTKAAVRAAVEQIAPQAPVQPSVPLPAEAVEQAEPTDGAVPPLTAKPIKRPSVEEIVEADKTRWVQRMAERAASLGWRRRGEPQARPAAQALTQAESAVRVQPAQPKVPQVEPAEPKAREQVEPAGWMQPIGRFTARLNLRQRARAIAGSLVAGFVVAIRGLATILRRTLPEEAAAGPRSRGVNTALMTIAVLIPLAVAALVAASYTQHSTMEQYQDRLNSASSEASQAIALKDPIERRQHWVSALNEANAALGIFPDSADARKIRDEAQRAIDQLDNVVRVNPALLWDFKSPGPLRLAVQGVNLFVLDRTVQQVFQLTLNEAGEGLTDEGKPKPRAWKSQNVREEQSKSDRLVGDLIDLVWMPLGGTRTRSSLVILDSGGLLDYDLSWNLKWVALGQGPTPLGARAIAGFGGNLYLLDTVAGQIWRYRPQGDGYGSTPEPYFDRPLDLSNTMDLAIDGRVYLLQADNSIRKFFGGKEEKFVISGLNEPLKRPVTLAVDAEARKGAVYVADAGMARIVQLSPDGAFIRQISVTGDAFNGLQDLIVDESSGRLFVVSNGKLYTARVPAAP